MTQLEQTIQNWWDYTINVNDLTGSLRTALDEAGFKIVKIKATERKPFVIDDDTGHEQTRT